MHKLLFCVLFLWCAFAIPLHKLPRFKSKTNSAVRVSDKPWDTAANPGAFFTKYWPDMVIAFNSGNKQPLTWVSEPKVDNGQTIVVSLDIPKENSGGMQIKVSGAKPDPDNRVYPNDEEFQAAWSKDGGFGVGGIGHPGTPEKPNYYKLSDYKTYLELMTVQGVKDGITEGHLLDMAAAPCLYKQKILNKDSIDGEHEVSLTLLSIWKYGIPFYTKQLGYFGDASLDKMSGKPCDFISTDEEKTKGKDTYDKYCKFAQIMKKVGTIKVSELMKDFKTDSDSYAHLRDALARTNNANIILSDFLNDASFNGVLDSKAACVKVKDLYNLFNYWDCDPCTTTKPLIEEVLPGFEGKILDVVTGMMNEGTNYKRWFGANKDCNAKLTCASWSDLMPTNIS